MIEKKSTLIWIDIATPKYALFFSKMIPILKKRNYDILVTTRYSENYTEAKAILDLNNIDYTILGDYGGNDLRGKFLSRLNRQKEIVDLFDTIDYPRFLLTGAVVDSVQTAYGLGIPVVNIYDTPATTFPNDPVTPKSLTPVSRLTLPYSTLFFYPFVIPSHVFDSLGIDSDKIIPYSFIDVCLWMDTIEKKEENDFRVKYNLDTNKSTVMIREEEYKAHYVNKQLPTLYELIYKLKELDINIVIMPRYEKEHLEKDFGSFTTVLQDKLKPKEYYPFIDLFIGGGGTMNLESVYYGIPTISTRSIWLIHDQYLVENNLMHWTDCSDKGLVLVKKLLGTRVDAKKYFCKGTCSFKTIIDKIENYFKD
jgi:predicted glycosyltransferase